MRLTEEIINNFSTQEYRKYRKEIRIFYDKHTINKEFYDKKRHSKLTIFSNRDIDGKECSGCLDFKTWKNFPNDKKSIDGKSRLCKDCHNQRQKIRFHTDINFRLISNLRKRVYNALKGHRKLDTTKDLVGCTIEELKNHLQSEFKKGMSWDNYGKWHVDHIKPCALFDMRKEAEQRKCFHYTNLQPLWAIDNIRKSDKW